MLSEVNDSLYTGRDRSKLNTVMNALIIIVMIALVLEIAFGIKYSGIYVIGPSMEPTLIGAPVTAIGEKPKPGGEYVYVDKTAQPYYRNIVVVYKDDGSTIIKRVIAMGGDRVKLVRGELYIKFKGTDDFVPVEQDYLAPENNTPSLIKNTFPLLNGNVDENGFLVEEGCLFLLGDNRNVSADSREDGGISFPLSKVYGVVTQWSLDNKNFISSVHQYFYFDLPRCFGFGSSENN